MNSTPNPRAANETSRYGKKASASMPKINDAISAETIRLVLEDGEQAGLVSREEAISKSIALGKDLVEVAPMADPPVCRIMDYGQFKYQQSKKQHEAKRHQKVIHLKEIKLRPKTETHDLNFKIKHALQFLDDGNKVKISVTFRGREVANPENGKELLNFFVEQLKESGTLETDPKMEGRNLFAILAPNKAKSSAQKKVL